MQYSVRVRNAQLDALEETIGASPVLVLRTGPAPTSASDPDAGVELSRMQLPLDWLDMALDGAKPKLGTWEDPSAVGKGLAEHFRVYDAGGVCHIQGTVSDPTGTGDLKLDNNNIGPTQRVVIDYFTIRAANV